MKCKTINTSHALRGFFALCLSQSISTVGIAMTGYALADRWNKKAIMLAADLAEAGGTAAEVFAPFFGSGRGSGIALLLFLTSAAGLAMSLLCMATGA